MLELVDIKDCSSHENHGVRVKDRIKLETKTQIKDRKKLEVTKKEVSTKKISKKDIHIVKEYKCFTCGRICQGKKNLYEHRKKEHQNITRTYDPHYIGVRQI